MQARERAPEQSEIPEELQTHLSKLWKEAGTNGPLCVPLATAVLVWSSDLREQALLAALDNVVACLISQSDLSSEPIEQSQGETAKKYRRVLSSYPLDEVAKDTVIGYATHFESKKAEDIFAKFQESTDQHSVRDSGGDSPTNYLQCAVSRLAELPVEDIPRLVTARTSALDDWRGVVDRYRTNASEASALLGGVDASGKHRSGTAQTVYKAAENCLVWLDAKFERHYSPCALLSYFDGLESLSSWQLSATQLFIVQNLRMFASHTSRTLTLQGSGFQEVDDQRQTALFETAKCNLILGPLRTRIKEAVTAWSRMRSLVIQDHIERFNQASMVATITNSDEGIQCVTHNGEAQGQGKHSIPKAQLAEAYAEHRNQIKMRIERQAALYNSERNGLREYTGASAKITALQQTVTCLVAKLSTVEEELTARSKDLQEAMDALQTLNEESAAQQAQIAQQKEEIARLESLLRVQKGGDKGSENKMPYRPDFFPTVGMS